MLKLQMTQTGREESDNHKLWSQDEQFTVVHSAYPSFTPSCPPEYSTLFSTYINKYSRIQIV